MRARATIEGEFVLPVGTVTLMLGDVESSTRRWEDDPEAMARAIDELNDVVDDVIGQHGGVRPVEQGEGDSFVAAFSRAVDAVACAVTLQRALGGHVLSIRLALHTGDVQLRGPDNYVGSTVNRCARLREIGHGGQTLVSAATHDLVVDRLPAQCRVVDLGSHRLRDLSRPEHVYQLVHPDLREAYPPLRSLDAVLTNLPAQLTSFVGRDTEQAEVDGLLREHRVVTLTGTGGCGKTRLAVHVAAGALDRFPDGAFFVDLAPLSSADEVPASVAAALGLAGEEPGVPTTVRLGAFLGPRHSVLVLDNCEHVIDACADLVVDVVSRCPNVTVLATSREPLSVPGEVTYRVPSLAVPPADEAPLPVDAVDDYAAVELFRDRAWRADPGFEVTPENSSAVADICRRLDGIPLAIELAAARVRSFTAHEISERVHDHFAFLTGGARTLLPRQQTLEASIAWSHDLLAEPERVLFRRLAVFTGWFSLDAARAMAGFDPLEAHQVVDQIRLLVDKSLVQHSGEQRASRYRILETVRHYAEIKLRQATEDQEARRRHADYFYDLAHELEPQLHDSRWREAEARLADSMDDLRVAMTLYAQTAAGTRLVDLVVALGVYWSFRGELGEAFRWADLAYESGGGDDTAVRAEVLRMSAAFHGFAAVLHGGTQKVVDDLERMVSQARAIGDKRATAHALAMLADGRLQQGDADAAASLLEEARQLASEAGVASNYPTAWVMRQLGAMDPEAATSFFEGAIADARRRGAVPELSAVASLSTNFLFEHDTRRVATLVEELLPEVPDGLGRCYLMMHAGLAARRLGRYDDAIHWGAAAAELAERVGFTSGVQFAKAGIANAALDKGDIVAADAACAACRSAGEALGWPGGGPFVNNQMALAQLASGNAAAAVEHARAAVASGFFLVQFKAVLARAALAAEDVDLAENEAHAVIALAAPQGANGALIDALEVLAGVEARAGNHRAAVRFVGAADAVRERIGSVRPPYFDRDHQRLVAEIKAALGDDYDALYAEGRRLSIREAVAYAQRGRGERKRPTAGWEALTPTERQVAGLVGEGLSNPQIAERLFMARRTVSTHVSHIFGKLGMSSRAELAAEVARRSGGGEKGVGGRRD